jgi:hypothetical protein
LNVVYCEQVSDTDKETYQTQVNEAMARYKQEYNDWFESLSADEQKVQIQYTIEYMVQIKNSVSFRTTYASQLYVVAIETITV